METLRITIDDLFRKSFKDERDFNKELTRRLINSNFDLSAPILKQPRSDIDGMDFIQFRYDRWDKLEADIWYYWRIFKIYIKNQFKKND